jgi:hypothetical protein
MSDNDLKTNYMIRLNGVHPTRRYDIGIRLFYITCLNLCYVLARIIPYSDSLNYPV